MDNNVYGIIPDDISGLIYLRYFLIANTSSDEKGTIYKVSKSIFTLPLKDLVLNNVGISEDIYPNLFNSLTLQIIDLSNNAITGSPNSIPNGNLIKLKLSSNQLTGALDFLKTSSKLQVIELQNNLFQGRIPELSNLTETLRVFDIRNNSLVGSFPVIIISIYIDVLF